MKVILFMLCITLPAIGISKGKKLHTIQNQNREKNPKDSWFGDDKVKHFLASAMITGAGSYICHHRYNQKKGKSRQTGVLLSFSFGIGKEILDKQSSINRFSFKDIIANIMGIATGYLLFTNW